MPSVTLTTDATNTAKLQLVVDFYNAQNATTYNIKQWITAMTLEAYRSWDNRRLQAQLALDQTVVVT